MLAEFLPLAFPRRHVAGDSVLFYHRKIPAKMLAEFLPLAFPRRHVAGDTLIQKFVQTLNVKRNGDVALRFPDDMSPGKQRLTFYDFVEVIGLFRLSTLHLLKFPERKLESMKILKNKLESMKILENNLESLMLQENQPVDGPVPLSIKNHIRKCFRKAVKE
uniref:Uncharacterized protein n=1 Tax=Tanacetum cinerariifolium TaxID=118510 RepID=A0A699J3W4_TANCI|nr:hypothetical protein [Tanacetum cinerariifolium]